MSEKKKDDKIKVSSKKKENTPKSSTKKSKKPRQRISSKKETTLKSSSGDVMLINEIKESSSQSSLDETIIPKDIASASTHQLKKEDFDWDSVIEEKESLDKGLLEMYSSTMPKIEEKQILDGRVVRISDREVIVDINFKSDGVISSTEFKYNPDLKIGDKVEIIVEKQEDKNGQLVLSHKRARILRSWEKVNLALESGEIVEGNIKSRTKGGMIVEVFGIEAFLPGSQIDVKPIRDYDEYVGRDMEFKVVKVNEAFRNIVVSHKALIEADLEGQKQKIISKLEKGQVIEGIVKNITSYGVFVDLGGIDGLIHITDLSWGRVSHPEEIVSLDEVINVVILEFDQEKKRIQLGLKQLGEHPWDSLDDKIQEGDEIQGKVVVVADYGVFVEVQEGIEALLHVSEMSWSTHLKSAADFYKVGDNIKSKILTLNREERKMSLGVKQLTDDPWNNIDKKYSKDSRHKVIVRNFTNFGIFVELEEGIDGLIHISDLSWTKKIKHPAEFTAIGEELEVVVLEVDVASRRISLGHKQLTEDPWHNYEDEYIPGHEFEGKVKEVFAKGSIITCSDELEAFCPLRHLEREDKEKVISGDILKFRVLEFSKENKRILVSHTSTFKDTKTKNLGNKKSDTDQEIKKIQKSQKKSTLADLDEISNIKDNLEDKEK